MRSRALLATLAFHVVVLICAMPASPWEFDEPLFFQALHHYDPVAHHPPPPGYPLFILFAQAVRLVIPHDFATLVAISAIGSVAGFVLLGLAFRHLTGDSATGVAGAVFFYFSPAMLIHSTLPISEPGALALLAAALYLAQRQASLRHTAAFAAFAALTVGWRIQFSIFVVPFFLTAVLLMRGWRSRVVALSVFTVVCIGWLIPLTIAVGGVEELIAFETGQGKYLAAHDAAESRTGWTPIRIAFRFIGRAWGAEWMALPVLALAAVGFVMLMLVRCAPLARFREGAPEARTTRGARIRPLLPLLAGSAAYLTVALLVMDPADGVRYSIPVVLAVALFAAAGATALARRFSLPLYVLPSLAVVAFILYVAPLLVQRRLIASPPVRAAAFARAVYPPHAVALYELPLWPHATYFLGEYDPHSVDHGLAKFYDRPDVPLFIYADGGSSQPGARVFRWKPTDAYRKLTRNHYRVVSIIPMPPERRFRTISGIHAPERAAEGREWRWLAPEAELQLPEGPPRQLTLHLGLSSAAPLETNSVMVSVDGTVVERAGIVRGTATAVTVAVPAGAPVIRLDSDASFVPAEVPALRSGDRRRLAAELYQLRTATVAAPPAPPRAR